MTDRRKNSRAPKRVIPITELVIWDEYTCLVHGKGEVSLIWDGESFYSEATELRYQHPDTVINLAAPLHNNED